jgi:peptidase C25-like protein
MPTKIVVTAQAAMAKKYGSGWSRVKQAVGRLVKADAKRGVVSRLVALDDAALGAHRARAGDAASFKAALDHVFAQEQRPDYVLILGGPDVVPHQSLRNPIDDDDADVPSDLPYACTTPAADDAVRFIAPTRVVGRLPDVPGRGSAARLLSLLDGAAGFSSRPRSDYEAYFGLSAEQWRRSTTLSLRAMFGAAAAPRTSPLEGPKWKRRDLAPLSHFINCHGGTIDPQFYGQRGAEYPVAHRAIDLPGNVAYGTVVAAECCYGAELYEPDAKTPAGVCMHYLKAGAIGFLGATNTAYGPATRNGSADLLCRFFLESVLGGATLGRALLEARLRFVKEASPLNPMELKTLAQFLLLGDPSLRAVAPQQTRARGAAAKALASAKAMTAHAARRAALSCQAAILAKGADSVASRADARAPRAVRSRLEEAARAAGCVPQRRARTYRVRRGVDPAARSALARMASGGKTRPAARKPDAAVAYHVLVATFALPLAPRGVKQRRAHPRPAGVSDKVVLLAREEGGKVVGVERLFAHGAPRPAHERVLRRTRRPQAGR